LNQQMLRGVPLYDGRGVLRKNDLFDSNLKTIGVAR
jgi:hypothetical protein